MHPSISQHDRAERLQAILSTVDECYKVVGENYSLLDMNQAGLEMIEAENMDEVRGACVLDLLLPEHHDTFKKGFEEALQGKRVTQVFEIEGLKGTR